MEDAINKYHSSADHSCGSKPSALPSTQQALGLQGMTSLVAHQGIYMASEPVTPIAPATQFYQDQVSYQASFFDYSPSAE